MEWLIKNWIQIISIGIIPLLTIYIPVCIENKKEKRKAFYKLSIENNDKKLGSYIKNNSEIAVKRIKVKYSFFGKPSKRIRILLPNQRCQLDASKEYCKIERSVLPTVLMEKTTNTKIYKSCIEKLKNIILYIKVFKVIRWINHKTKRAGKKNVSLTLKLSISSILSIRLFPKGEHISERPIRMYLTSSIFEEANSRWFIQESSELIFYFLKFIYKSPNPKTSINNGISYTYDLKKCNHHSIISLFIFYLFSLRKPKIIPKKHSIEYFSSLKNTVPKTKLIVEQIGIDGSDYDPHLYIGDNQAPILIGNKNSVYKVQGGIVMMNNPHELRYLSYSNFIKKENVDYNAFVLKNNNEFEIYSLEPRYSEIFYGVLTFEQRTLFDKKLDEILNPKKYQL